MPGPVREFLALGRDLVATPRRVLATMERRPSVLLIVVLYLATEVGTELVYPAGYVNAVRFTEVTSQEHPDPNVRERAAASVEHLRQRGPLVYTMGVVGVHAAVLVIGALLLMPLALHGYGRLLRCSLRTEWLIRDASLCFIVVILGSVIGKLLLAVPGRASGVIGGIVFWSSILWCGLLMGAAVGPQFRASFEPTISSLRKFLWLNWVAWLIFRDPVRQRLASLRWLAFAGLLVVALIAGAAAGVAAALAAG